MDADIHTLYTSDFYRIVDFKCRCVDCRTSKPEVTDTFCISFVRKGNFLFNVFRRVLDSYNGTVLVTKPGYEHTVTHTHTVPDECTIFDFTPAFSTEVSDRWGNTSFFRNNDLHSTLLHTSAEMEFLHFYVAQQVMSRSGSRLQIDQLVMEIVEKILSAVTDYTPNPFISGQLKKHHLITIEKAKEYITGHFTEDISLIETARYCHISPFHFSRVFKAFTSTSPHQFLLGIRLKQAELLLRDGGLPVADIAFSSGFNSLEHFSAAFSKKYRQSPTAFRAQKSRIS
ncbi:MAG TPA: AraC family transcriptional regulator [Chitinophagaceae bacterium]|jgi:AraC-like DNA-binding protein